MSPSPAIGIQINLINGIISPHNFLIIKTFYLRQTIFANSLSHTIFQSFHVAAKYTAGRVFFEDNAITVRKDLQSGMFFDLHHMIVSSLVRNFPSGLHQIKLLYV